MRQRIARVSEDSACVRRRLWRWRWASCRTCEGIRLCVRSRESVEEERERKGGQRGSGAERSRRRERKRGGGEKVRGSEEARRRRARKGSRRSAEEEGDGGRGGDHGPAAAASLAGVLLILGAVHALRARHASVSGKRAQKMIERKIEDDQEEEQGGRRREWKSKARGGGSKPGRRTLSVRSGAPSPSLCPGSPAREVIV